MIDSCTMQFPFDVCEGFALDQMIHIPKTLDNEVISNTYQAPSNKLPIGIGSIKVDWKNEFVLIDASATKECGHTVCCEGGATSQHLHDVLERMPSLMVPSPSCTNPCR